MTPHEATRTLVKSPPEVWAQCSEAEALERHLNGSFGEIRITRLEPETAVAWEGEQVRGTVRIEPSAWGTRVTLTAQLEQEAAPAGPNEPVAPPPAAVESPPAGAIGTPPPSAAEAPPEPAQPPAAPGRSKRLWARLALRFRTAPPPPEPTPAPSAPPPVLEEPASAAEELPPLVALAPPADPIAEAILEPTRQSRPDPVEVLKAALDSLGQAHHRPYSRA